MSVQTSISEGVIGRYKASMMNTFGAPRLVIDHGEGPYLVDDDGKRYLDLLGGIAVNSLGHGHPRLAAAIADQAAKLIHVSNFFATDPQVQLSERLGAIARNGADVPTHVFFTNSGTEANEAAFKLTRRTGRTRVIAMEGCFHGRTMGALALTSKAAYRTPFEPLPGDVTFVPYGDADALEAAMDDTVAAVVIEPIQGEVGVAVPPQGWVKRVREITAAHGALMWVDEVQTGMGRCGLWFDHQREGVLPDIVTVAKGLGGGFPIGACIALGPAGELFQPGNHGTTFGGNPLAARAGNAVLDVIEEDGLLAHVNEVGDWLAGELAKVPGVAEVRGRGLLRGVVLERDIAPAVYEAGIQAGFIANAPRPGVLRLAPPYIVTQADLQPFVDALPELLRQAA